VKTGWTTKPLSEVCTFKPQKSEARAKLTSEDEVSFVPMENLGIGSKELTLTGTRSLAEVAGSYTYFAEGDVLLAKITPCFENGKLGIARNLVNGVGFGSSEYIVIRPSPEVDADFLYHFLDRATFREEGAKQMTGAVGHKRVPKEYVEGALIPVPTIEEQRRIVTLLDEAFADIATAKANAEKNLQNARELFDNALQSLVDGTSNDWTQRTMAEVCDITSKLVDPREDQYLDLPHVGAGNIESKISALVDVKTAREENLISGKFLFDESMVLYSKIRPYLMKVLRPDFNGLCSADIYPLAPKPGVITRDYLYYLLLAPAFTEYAIKGSARAGMPKVNREHLFAYPFVLPKVQDQKRIAENLDQIANETIRLESIYRQKLTALADLKKSLLHQAFSGQL
jgi:type I restriction enzyme S subunit